MKRGPQGRQLLQRVPGESFQAFVPYALPPDPPIVWDVRLFDALERANRALGRLDGLALLLPDLALFLYYYVRKEAVLSSQIEGTQSSLSDLLLFESDESSGVPLEDVQEVSNYVAALNYGVERLESGAPLTLRLIREIHGVLLSRGRGQEQQPGEFRRSQNWIGGSRPGNALFVPPPPQEVMGCLDAWEKFLHDIPERTPTLIKAALLHVQFETIHPFLDGNGRIGRLLISLLLCYEKALEKPLLYLSLYLKTHRTTYYDLLQTVRMEGDWEAWLLFFLEGVRETAGQATQAAQAIFQQTAEDRAKIERLGRIAGSALRLHHWIQRKPIFTIEDAAQNLQITPQTVINSLRRLQSIGLVQEISGRQRNQIFIYAPLINLLKD